MFGLEQFLKHRTSLVIIMAKWILGLNIKILLGIIF